MMAWQRMLKDMYWRLVGDIISVIALSNMIYGINLGIVYSSSDHKPIKKDWDSMFLCLG
jgi:hypothetical protein